MHRQLSDLLIALHHQTMPLVFSLSSAERISVPHSCSCRALKAGGSLLHCAFTKSNCCSGWLQPQCSMPGNTAAVAKRQLIAPGLCCTAAAAPGWPCVPASSLIQQRPDWAPKRLQPAVGPQEHACPWLAVHLMVWMETALHLQGFQGTWHAVDQPTLGC